MKYIETRIKSESAYILPIGDIHIGDKNVDYKLLEDTIQWVAETKDVYVVGMGDWLNVATRGSKSSPFQQNMDLTEQVEKTIELFKPIQNRIVGLLQGNHEKRIEEFCGYDPLIAICHALDTKYLKYSAVLSFVVGKGHGVAYTMYAHHTSGAGQTPGSKMNRVNKLRSIVCNCDCYLGGHNHGLGVIPVCASVVDTIHKVVNRKRQLLIDCGSYLKWDDAYSEQMMLEPVKLGSPRIRLDGKKRDAHCSI